jgi:hypothetical protein
MIGDLNGGRAVTSQKVLCLYANAYPIPSDPLIPLILHFYVLHFSLRPLRPDRSLPR